MLMFTEMVKVARAGSYEKEFWAMSEEERIASIPALKEEGNGLYKAGDHEGANKKYSEALGRLEQLMLRYIQCLFVFVLVESITF